MWKDDRGSTMWEVRVENVDKKSSTGAEKDQSISSSCGLPQELSGATVVAMRVERRSAHEGDDNRQRDKAKWRRYHGSVVVLLRDNHGHTIAEKLHTVTKAEFETLYKRSGDSWLVGRIWQGRMYGKNLVEMMQLGSTETKTMFMGCSGLEK